MNNDRKMTKYYIDEDELWPVYFLTERETGDEVELTPAEFAEYERVMADFFELQDKLRRAVND